MIASALQHPARRIRIPASKPLAADRLDVRIYILDEAMIVSVPFDLVAIERLIVLRICFTTNGIANSGSCHQVAFIGPINELRTAISPARFHRDGFNTRSLKFNSGRAIPDVLSITSVTLASLIIS